MNANLQHSSTCQTVLLSKEKRRTAHDGQSERPALKSFPDACCCKTASMQHSCSSIIVHYSENAEVHLRSSSMKLARTRNP
mmetsp:Transcript_1532/g.3892  ORF Transcript_1532/g.3892 Transcript_1532/m.3892 type:complete len:81 (+) Transcript_1532:275-517(+)